MPTKFTVTKGERGQDMSSYPRCSIGVPWLAARVGGWVCGGPRGVFNCMYDKGGFPGGLRRGWVGWGGMLIECIINI